MIKAQKLGRVMYPSQPQRFHGQAILDDDLHVVEPVSKDLRQFVKGLDHNLFKLATNPCSDYIIKLPGMMPGVIIAPS